MVAGLPKDPIERKRSIRRSCCRTIPRGASRQTRSPNVQADACPGRAIGGFSLRGEVRSIGI